MRKICSIMCLCLIGCGGTDEETKLFQLVPDANDDIDAAADNANVGGSAGENMGGSAGADSDAAGGASGSQHDADVPENVGGAAGNQQDSATGGTGGIGGTGGSAGGTAGVGGTGGIGGYGNSAGTGGTAPDSGTGGISGNSGIGGSAGTEPDSGIAGNGGAGGVIDSGTDIDAAPECLPNAILGSFECPAISCSKIDSDLVGAKSGNFWLKPNPILPQFEGFCDIGFENIGWTLIYSSMFGDFCPQEGYPSLSKAAYLSADYVKSLANMSTKIHIISTETFGQTVREEVISVENTTPIKNLRQLKIINDAFYIENWYGSMANSFYLKNYNPVTGTMYPDIWWANNNSHGTHITTNGNGGVCYSRWNVQNQDKPILVFVGGP